MSKWRVRTTFQGQKNIYPEKFNTKKEAETFVRDQLPFSIPATLIEHAISSGMIEFYQESTLVDREGKPIEIKFNDGVEL